MYDMTVSNAVLCEWGGAGNHKVQVVPNVRAGVRCEHRQIFSQLSNQNFRVYLWNGGTMKGRSNKVVEIMYRRKVDFCGLQKV